MVTLVNTWRVVQRTLLVVTGIAVAMASLSGWAQAPAPALRAVPNALLSIDQNRSTVVDRIVGDWGDALAKSTAGISAEQLRDTLLAMRADYLLAASVVGSLEGLRNVIASSLIGSEPASAAHSDAKSLGDSTDDLIYTPVVPCRLADTRNVAGWIGPAGSRDFKVWVASGGFAAQGGNAGNCTIPANPAAVVLNVTAVNVGGAGNLIIYPTGAAVPNTSALNYQSGIGALSNGAIVPACTPNCANQITVRTNGAGTDVVIDILGYFAAPLTTALQCTQITSANTVIPVSADTLVALPSCAAGYTRTGSNCAGAGSVPGGYLLETNATGCLFRNLSSVTTYNATASSTCCRIPGR